MSRNRFTQICAKYVSDPRTIRLIRYRYYTIGEVAQMLRVTEQTIRNYLQRGELKAVKYGDRDGVVRIQGEALMRFIHPYKPGKKMMLKKVRRVDQPKTSATAKEPNPQSPAPRPAEKDHK